MNPDPSNLITWYNLGTVGIGLALLYGALRLLDSRIERGLYLQQADGLVRTIVRVALLAFEPISLLVMLALFVAIWPLVHGLIVALLVFVLYQYLRDFVAGRVFRFDRAVQLGRRLVGDHGRGTIAGFGTTGLYVQLEEGRSRIPYATLVRGGYTVTTDSERGGYFQLQILIPEGDTSPQALRTLRNVLVDSPYVRDGFDLESHTEDGDHLVVDVNLGVYSAEHVQYLTGQLQERGYTATLLPR